jgi:hypothetical protein
LVVSVEGIPFVLGRALCMKAIHGGKTKKDRVDAKKISGGGRRYSTFQID